MLAHIAMVAQGKLAENRHSPQSPHLPYLPCAIKSTEIHFACPAFPTRPACRGGASRASRAAGQVGPVGQEGQSHCHVGPPKIIAKQVGRSGMSQCRSCRSWRTLPCQLGSQTTRAPRPSALWLLVMRSAAENVTMLPLHMVLVRSSSCLRKLENICKVFGHVNELPVAAVELKAA